jgi:hypothetical protein
VKDYDDVPSAVEVLRKTLAAQDDNSVVISSIGMTTNMRDLIQSKGDSFSSLNGHDLVAKKVKSVVWMDGDYNFGCAQHDSDDWLGDDADCRGSAKIAVEGWPSTVKQIYNAPDIGSKVNSGGILSSCAPSNNPCRKSYEDWWGQ